MKKLLVAISLFIISISAFAEQALSKNLIEKYMKSIADIELLAKANPALEEKMDNLMMFDKNSAIDALKSLDIYPKIQSRIKSAGFSGLNEFYDISLRLMGGIFKTQMNKMPDGMTADSFISQMENQIAQMKKQGLPESMLTEMEEQFKQQLKSMKSMQKAAENVSAADVKFVSDNIEWITKAMPFDKNSDH
jgi:hypothetical protein